MPVNPGKKTCTHTGMKYKGIQELPTQWEDWFDVVKALAQAAVDTFGIEEVRGWSFECCKKTRPLSRLILQTLVSKQHMLASGNELWGMPFPGSYMKLYNATAHAVKAVDSQIKVGGPATAQLQDVKQFHDLATAGGMPFDFVSTHMYPTDPQLGKGVHWDPSGLIDHVKAARASVPDKPFYLTEYNVGCCIGYQGHDTSAAAAYAWRCCASASQPGDLRSERPSIRRRTRT